MFDLCEEGDFNAKFDMIDDMLEIKNGVSIHSDIQMEQQFQQMKTRDTSTLLSENI